MLARLLTPADFGAYAVALAVITFAMVVNDAGIIAACVQWRGKFEEMAPTAALMALLTSLFLYGVLWWTVPALMRPTIGAATAAAVILLIDSVVNGNSFVQLSLAGGAGMIVYILVVVPLDKLRQVTTLRAHFR